jgi:hypothetical protein
MNLTGFDGQSLPQAMLAAKSAASATIALRMLFS